MRPCRAQVSTVFFVSPANLSGRRGQYLLGPKASSALAAQLASPEGAALGELFCFVSGLYFRGKLTYAQAFGQALVMTAGGGLLAPEERIDRERLQRWSTTAVHESNPHFTAPLTRAAAALADQQPHDTRFVLLGSLATNKYIAPLLDVFGSRLLYPRALAGMGDMSRGALLLRAAKEQRELEYVPVAARD